MPAGSTTESQWHELEWNPFPKGLVLSVQRWFGAVNPMGDRSPFFRPFLVGLVFPCLKSKAVPHLVPGLRPNPGTRNEFRKCGNIAPRSTALLGHEDLGRAVSQNSP